MESAAAKINILLACEESQTVCAAFRARGFNAWSCDILPSSGPLPHYHIQGDVLPVFSGYACGKPWHCIIAFPPCTHLAVSGSRWFEQKRADGRQQQAIEFFMKMVNAPAMHVAIENPVGIMSKIYQKPTQIIQPFYFGDSYQKTTCLWLKNLPRLYHVKQPDLFNEKATIVSAGDFYTWVDKKTGKIKKQPLWYAQAKGFGGKKNGTSSGAIRSKTFPGIAAAMAQQWGDFLLNQYTNP